MKKRWIALFACMALVFSMVAAGCATDKPETSNPPTESNPTETQQGTEPSKEPTGYIQGVTDTEILIGNTAETTGTFATVGVPFNAGIEAVLKQYNEAGGFNGKTVRLLHYDAGGDGAQGLTYTKQLVDDDKVFALVGHFGTWTVASTLDYIKEKGVPMVYAATGISELYQEGATGKDACVFSVQPIYDAEGRVLLARAMATTEGNYGLGGTKIGCIATTDDAGEGLKAGVERQAQEANVEIVYQDVDAAATDYSAAVNVLKNAGCDVVIIATNQAPMENIMAAMRDANYNAKCITSYVSASVTTLGKLVENGAVTAERPIYTTAWMDTTTEAGMADYGTFAETMLAWEAANGIDSTDPAQTYVLNAYAMAGYVAGKLFVHGLEQVKASGEELTWESYIAALESAPFHIPMGGELDFAGGDRLGVTALALNTISTEINPDTGYYAMQAVSPIMSLDDVWAKVG